MEISLICAFMDNCVAFYVEDHIVTEFAVCFVYFKIHNGNILHISFENLLFQSMIALLMDTEVASSFSLLQAKLSIHPCVLVFHIYLAHIICRLTGYTQLQLYQMLLDCSSKTFVYSE